MFASVYGVGRHLGAALRDRLPSPGQVCFYEAVRMGRFYVPPCPRGHFPGGPRSNVGVWMCGGGGWMEKCRKGRARKETLFASICLSKCFHGLVFKRCRATNYRRNLWIKYVGTKEQNRKILQDIRKILVPINCKNDLCNILKIIIITSGWKD